MDPLNPFHIYIRPIKNNVNAVLSICLNIRENQ